MSVLFIDDSTEGDLDIYMWHVWSGCKTFLDLEDLVVHLMFREIRKFSFHTMKFRIQIIGCPVFIRSYSQRGNGMSTNAIFDKQSS